MSDKPPYVIPTMAEVRALPWNGYRVASLFAGGGGSSTGYRMAGYRVVYANEFVEAAAETYRANAADYTVVDTRDVRGVTGAEILEAAGVDRGELDVLDGSPPCASFSTAGARSKKWGKVSEYSDTQQRTDDLFLEYARLVGEVQPKVFVAENVSGLVKGVSKGYFKMIFRLLRDQGYRVEARLLNAARLGVPQSRQRIIFVGVRDDLGVDPVHPTPFGFQYSMVEVLPHLAYQANGSSFSPHSGTGKSPASVVVEKDIGTGEFSVKKFDQVSRTITASGIDGRNKAEYGLLVYKDSFRSPWKIQKHEGPCMTVTAHGMGQASAHQFAVHVGDTIQCPETGREILLTESQAIARAFPDLLLRQLSIPEVRVICSFPSDYVLTGNYARRWERMGRSVPPLMMRAIAETIRDGVLPQCAG